MLKKFCILVTMIACVIGIVGCAWGSVSLSAIPDPEFRKYLKGYDIGWIEYDSNGHIIHDDLGNEIHFGKGNGILDDKEIERIVGIDVDVCGIKSLKGIEHLTALTSLICGGNQLTELDLSNNTVLTQLWCENNQLTALDLSRNTALNDLSCYNNQLTTLKISRNNALAYLSCYNNQLTTLDVSGCTGLVLLTEKLGASP